MSTQQNRQIRELVDGLSQRPDRPMPTLRPEEPRGGIPSRRGYVEKQYQPGSGGSGGGGIASPLTEQERVYADEPIYVEAMDGSGYFRVRPIVQMTMTDAESREIVFDFADRAGSL